jgi:lipopolysaccharide transport system permease protein
MKAGYQELDASASDRKTSLRVRFILENRGAESWHSKNGYHIGSQIYDPENGTFITEGEWSPIDIEVTPGAKQPLDLQIALPPQNGPYRVYISPLHERDGWLYPNGGKFVVVDAVVDQNQVRSIDARVTTIGALRRKGLRRAIPKAFTLPILTVTRNWRLIKSMVRRDILARYKGSFGDAFWTILNPLLLMSTYFFVFGIVLQTHMGPDQSRTSFALYFLAGFLPWLAISEAVGRAPTVILDYRNLVKKLVFPLETLPVNHVLAGFVTEMFALALYLIALVILRGMLPVSALWLPALLIPQIMFTLGLCWLLAATGAYARDLGQVIGFMLTLWFFITPICYSEGHFSGTALAILSKNPLFVLVRGYRAVLLEGQAPQFNSLWKLWVVSIILFVAGHAWFHKLRKSFADVI